MFKNFKQTLEDVTVAASGLRYGVELLDILPELKRYLLEPALEIGSETRLKAVTLTSELFDYFGRTHEAYEVIAQSGQEAVDQVRQHRYHPELLEEQFGKQPEHLRLILRVASNHAMVSAYRSGDYREARGTLTRCLEVVEYEGEYRRGESELEPFWGTIGHLHYNLGRIHRQLSAYDSSEESFGQALLGLRRQARSLLTDSAIGDEERQSQILRTNYKAALALALGLGWLAYARGQLRRALGYLNAAGSVLANFPGDQLNRARLDLIYGITLRALGGPDIEAIEKSTDWMKAAFDIFETVGHEHFKAMAAHELALSHLYLAKLADSEDDLVEALTRSSKWCEQAANGFRDDFRWTCNCRLLESRILRQRNKFQAAHSLATNQVCDPARQYGYPLQLLDGLIARAEASIQLGEAASLDVSKRRNFDSAIADLEEARALNHGQNKQTDGVLNIHLARAYYSWDIGRARGFLRQWRSVKPEIENQNVRAMGLEMERLIESVRNDLVISADESLDYRHQDDKLKRYLIKRAEERVAENPGEYSGDGKEEKIASALGVARPTLHSWKKKLDISANKPRGGRLRAGHGKLEA